MEIRNLDDGSTYNAPDRPRRDSVNGVPTPQVTFEDISRQLGNPNQVRPPREFPPVRIPTYTVHQPVGVGNYVAAIGIIFVGLLAVLFAVAFFAGQL